MKFTIKILLMYFACINASYSCELTILGKTFLEKSSQLGKRTDSTCMEKDDSKNLFLAAANKSCEIIFDSSKWFNNGSKFISLNGNGTFKVVNKNDVITIKLQPKKGFSLTSITLKSNENKCKGVSVDDYF